jgi:hypothetical protein
MRSFFEDGRKNRQLDLDQLLAELGKPLTNMHVAEERREEYSWQYAVPEGAKKGDRRLE